MNKPHIKGYYSNFLNTWLWKCYNPNSLGAIFGIGYTPQEAYDEYMAVYDYYKLALNKEDE